MQTNDAKSLHTRRVFWVHSFEATSASAIPTAMRTFRVLVTDDVDPEGVDLLRAAPGFQVDERPTIPWRDLLDVIDDYDAIVGRSATQVPAELLRRAGRLQVIGRAGVGTDNIDIPEATSLGIAVINAPAGNTISVAELFFGSLIALLRHLPDAFSSMRAGRWDRSALLGSELRGRTLGIIGLGRIGSEIAIRARAFGMIAIAFDPYITADRFERLQVARAVSLDALLGSVDVATIHTPLTTETRGMIRARELGLMKAGAVIANMARGGIVDETDLVAELSRERIRGALLDVFSKEPLAADSPLRTTPRLVLTPHLGASTAEGQRNVSVDVCASVRDALLSGVLSSAVNVAGGERVRWDDLADALLLARRAAAMARALLADRGATAVDGLTLRLGKGLSHADTLLLSAASIGVVEAVVESGRLNIVNGRAQAEARGIALSVAPTTTSDQLNLMQITVRSAGDEMTIAGVAMPGASPRITRIGSFAVDVTPRRTMIVLTNADVPGVIGRVGTLLGDAGVNIAEYHQSRVSEGGNALAAITVDGAIGAALRDELLASQDVRSVTVVNFADSATNDAKEV
jgi:D-3-phosphoglycerate dehydrogenase / 2-oxoglutarate reductase